MQRQAYQEVGFARHSALDDTQSYLHPPDNCAALRRNSTNNSLGPSESRLPDRDRVLMYDTFVPCEALSETQE